MNRRDFLKYLLATPIAYQLDVEKLLWVPGEKTIFLPSPHLSYSQILALEYKRIIPLLKYMFEQEDFFYAHLKSKNLVVESSREIRIPLQIIPGKTK